MSRLTLSFEMMPCDWIGSVTIRSDTFGSRSISGEMSRRPGSFVPTIRPSRKCTPRSYCCTTRTVRSARTTRTTAAAMSQIQIASIALLRSDAGHGRVRSHPAEDEIRPRDGRQVAFPGQLEQAGVGHLRCDEP